MILGIAKRFFINICYTYNLHDSLFKCLPAFQQWSRQKECFLFCPILFFYPLNMDFYSTKSLSYSRTRLAEYSFVYQCFSNIFRISCLFVPYIIDILTLVSSFLCFLFISRNTKNARIWIVKLNMARKQKNIDANVKTDNNVI